MQNMIIKHATVVTPKGSKALKGKDMGKVTVIEDRW